MTMHQQASLLAPMALRRDATREQDSSLAAVVLWVALGLILALAAAMLSPGVFVTLETLS